MLEKLNLSFPKIPKSNYQPQSQDTAIESDIYFFQKWRQLSLKQRIERFISHEQGVKKLCLVGIKSRNRNSTIQEIRVLFTRAVLGEKFTPDFQPKGINENMWIQDSISLAGELHQLFELINIDYYVNRGVASSIHGEPRSTRDLDLVIEVKPNQIDLLVKTLEASGYYCPAGAVEDLQRGLGNMLNITHTETIANADIYITDKSPYSISQMNRKILIDVEGIPAFWIASAEDIILQKLLWGKGSKSEKQWRDVLGIIKLQADNLDYHYLTEWAENLDLVADLSEVLTQSGI
jgi:hypothetical protein